MVLHWNEINRDSFIAYDVCMLLARDEFPAHPPNEEDQKSLFLRSFCIYVKDGRVEQAVSVDPTFSTPQKKILPSSLQIQTTKLPVGSRHFT